MSALHFINDKTIHKDQSVLVYGASGSVGSYALQIAKYYGAKVTAVSSQKNHQALLGLGADQVIDYKKN
jgi:NADPH:quinone reductase-like Zn-dependent oxidoreductase